MAMSGFVVGDAVDVQIHLNKDSVSRFVKSGNDLVIEQVNGDTLTLSNFYTETASGEAHRLLYADGTFSGVEGVWDDEDAGRRAWSGVLLG